MDGFFVAKLKKFAPGERKAASTSGGVPDKDAPEANEAGGSADGMDVDHRFVRLSSHPAPLVFFQVLAVFLTVFRVSRVEGKHILNVKCS